MNNTTICPLIGEIHLFQTSYKLFKKFYYHIYITQITNIFKKEGEKFNTNNLYYALNNA